MRSGVQRSSSHLFRNVWFFVWMQWGAECNCGVRILSTCLNAIVWMQWGAECNYISAICNAKSATVWMQWGAECNSLTKYSLWNNDHVWMQWGAECNLLPACECISVFQVWMQWGAECNNTFRLYVERVLRCVWMQWGAECNKAERSLLWLLLKGLFECNEERSAILLLSLLSLLRLWVWMRWGAECNRYVLLTLIKSCLCLNAMRSGVQYSFASALKSISFMFECDEERSAMF